jgi:phosphatidylglycerol:prolipoprotein diacylglycerol transferase
MLPKLFSIGPITLHTYGVMLAVAFVVGLLVASRQARREGLDSGRVTDLGIYVLIAGLIGAKLMLVVVEWRVYVRNPKEILSIIQSGGVFYGGLLAALPVAWWYTRRHRLAGWRVADVLAPGVVIGQAIGRLGCLAAGCCWGIEARVAGSQEPSIPWAITFTNLEAYQKVGMPLGTPLHPTQIYESLAALLIFAALLWVARRKRFHGQVTAGYLLLYSTARFVIEFFRGDPSRGFVRFTDSFGLSTSQVVAVVVVLAVAAGLPYLVRTQRTASPPTA